MPVTRAGAVAFAASLALLNALAPAAADPTEDFYRTKGLTILVGSDAGGGYDSYARVVARYWPKYLPGHPAITVKLMPGAGGEEMQNFLANQAPRDGSVIGATRAIFLVEPLLYGEKFSHYDPQKMNWIGNISAQQTGCFVLQTNPIKTAEDAMHREVKMGLTSILSNGSIIAHIFNALAGTQFTVIPGYSSKDTYIAVERGEVDGSCLSYATVSAAAPGLVEANKLNFLLFIGLTRTPQLPDVPVLGELLKQPQDKDVVQLIMASLTMGRPYEAPEGVPPERLDALRQSFMATLKDPEFLEEAKKEKLIVDPSDHMEIEDLITAAYRAPAPVVERTRRIIEDASRR